MSIEIFFFDDILFQAHESSVKCLAIDPHEEIFVTGSADGDIKVNTKALVDFVIIVKLSLILN